MITAEQIAQEWEATEHLPPDQREHRRDILAIRYSDVVRERERAIDAAPNVIRLVDARTKLPREGA